ncbi:MAG: leucine-rich repeat domain-containing protein [Clostridia bacterium]|nr:leucine-rich repeat domain-containing protein [Clostridia bacterium]
MSAMTDYAEQLKAMCDSERKRMLDVDKRIREGAKVRAVTGLLLSVVILIIAWTVAGIMRQKAVFIVAGIASGLAALLCMQFIPAKLRYVKVDGGYIVYGCIKFLRPCRAIPEKRRSLPVIGIADGAFEGTKKMYYLTLPATVRIIGKRAFAACSDLRGLILPEDSALADIGDECFKGCVNMTAFYAGESIGSIGKSCFDGCNVLKHAYLGSSIAIIGEGAFAGCGNLDDVNLSDKIITLPKAAFSGCCNLKQLILPSNLEKIETDCFAYCSSLTEIRVPPKVSYIGQCAFKDCSAARLIYIDSKPQFIGDGAFRNCKEATLRFKTVRKAQNGWNGQCFDNRMRVVYAEKQ